MREWEPSFDFYMAYVDGAPASFVIDLAARAPVATHPVRLHIRVKMLTPRDDGLRDKSEFDALAKLEDDVVERIEKGLGAIYVARMIHSGFSEMFFYVPAKNRKLAEAPLPILGDLGAYSAEWLVEDDAEWSLFTDFLYPDPYSMQAIQNRHLLEQIKEHGDAIDVPREVDHLAYFPTRAAAGQAVTALTAKGYRCDDVEEEDEAHFSVGFHRKDAIDGERPDEFCREILDIVLPLEGDYDGWGAPIVKP